MMKFNIPLTSFPWHGNPVSPFKFHCSNSEAIMLLINAHAETSTFNKALWGNSDHPADTAIQSL